MRAGIGFGARWLFLNTSLTLACSSALYAAAAFAPAVTLNAIVAQARKAGVSNSIETVSGRLEGWARQKSVTFERVRLTQRGAQWIASTRNTLGESRTFQLPLDARAKALHGRGDNLLVGIIDEETMAMTHPLSPGNFSPVRELPVDAVSGAPRRAVTLRLVARGRDTLDFEILIAK